MLVAAGLCCLAILTQAGSAHGIEFRARGPVTAVGGPTMPTTITIATADGPVILGIEDGASFTLDEPAVEGPEFLPRARGARSQGGVDGYMADLTTLVGHFVTATY